MPENESKQLTPQEIAEQRKLAEEKAVKTVNAPVLTGATDAGTSSALGAGVEQIGQSAGQQAISQAYHSPIKDLSDTISGLEQKRKDAIAQDETAQRRARNMQMIAGISDGLASLANLIGVGQGGTNIDMGQGALTPLQQRLEEARKERKADIKSIDERLEQYRRQLDQMKLQRGVAVAEQGERDMAAERARQEKISDREFQEKLLNIRLENEAKARKENQEFTASENEKNRKNQAAMNNADNKVLEERYKAELAAKSAKEAMKPENQRRVMNENITGIRDELARDMGYTDYNEYLRYKNVDGWGEDIEGQRNRKTKKIRAERARNKPETEQLLEMLSDPTVLDDSAVQMMAGASKTFSDALKAATGNAQAPKLDNKGRIIVDY